MLAALPTAYDLWTGTPGRATGDLPEDWMEARYVLEKRCSGYKPPVIRHALRYRRRALLECLAFFGPETEPELKKLSLEDFLDLFLEL